jgi:hypothetical protein
MKSVFLHSYQLCVALLVLGLMEAGADGPGAVALVRAPEGGLQPQAVVDAEGTLHLVYLKGDSKACDVFYARRDTGRTNFSTPVRVNSESGSAVAMGTVRGAQIALGRKGRIHVAWNGCQPAARSPGDGAPMLYARMNDAGTGFEPQRNLMTATKHLDGGGSVAADPEGNVYVAWHGHRRTGPQDEPARAVFIAKSPDDGKTFAAEQPVSPAGTGACGCCGLKSFVDERGRVAVLYRSAAAAGDRDVTLLVSEDHGKTFQATVLGPWRVSVCPMSTMSLGAGSEGTLMAMWETKGQVWYSTITLGGPGTLPAKSPSGSPGQRKHPVFATSQKGPGLLLAWTEGTGWARGGSLAWERVDSGGAPVASGRADGVPVWGRVTAVAEPDGTFTVVY